MDLKDNLVNRKNQIQCLKTASELGLGPICLYSNAQDGVLITEYIQSSKIIDELKVRLAPHLELTSCHNDLNFTNLLYDGEKTFFIDWEAAGQEDPFFDIATICNEFITNDEDMAYFMSQYFNGIPSAYQQAKVFAMRQISYCYLALHFLDHAANAGLLLNQNYPLDDIPTINEWIQGYSTGKYYLKSADDFILYAMTKIKGSLEQMQTSTFIAALNEFTIEPYS